MTEFVFRSDNCLKTLNITVNTIPLVGGNHLETTIFGTVDFDNRSFRINFEITMRFTHDKMIKAVERMLKRDFADANKVDLEKRGGRQTLVMRFLSQAARLFSPIL